MDVLRVIESAKVRKDSEFDVIFISFDLTKNNLWKLLELVV